MDQRFPPRYVLVTPARNEAAFIAKTIESRYSSDCSAGEMGDRERWVHRCDRQHCSKICRQHIRGSNWLIYLYAERANFAAKVHAFNAGQENLKDIQYEIIGNLDADVWFDDDHFEFLAE